MLKLNASFSKKVPAETEYSSQSYHAQVEIELPDGLTQQQLREKVHGVFEFVRSSVESELRNAHAQYPAVPPNASESRPNGPQPAPVSDVHYGEQPQPLNGRGNTASPKQINYLLALSKRAGWTMQQLLQRCQVSSIEEIAAKTCSRMIQQLTGQVA